MRSPIKVIAILVARPGKADELAALLGSMVTPSRAEPGNVHYNLYRDQTDPNRFVLDELYTDDAANVAHRATPHFENYLSKINRLADRDAMLLDPLMPNGGPQE